MKAYRLAIFTFDMALDLAVAGPDVPTGGPQTLRLNYSSPTIAHARRSTDIPMAPVISTLNMQCPFVAGP